MRIKFIVQLIVVLIGIASASYAQINPNPVINEVLLEKLKVPVEWLLHPGIPPREQQRAEQTRMLETGTMEGDQPVYRSFLPESEVHAIINVKDSSNIIVSAMQLNSSDEQPLICPIWYSKDFGKTWKKSTFQSIPPVINPSILGGGDPVFACDADGKLYFSWINLFLINNNVNEIHVGMMWSSSTDGGATWTMQFNPYIGHVKDTPSNLHEMYDKQWLAVDRTTSPWRGTVYAALTYFHEQTTQVGLRKKVPENEYFSPTVRISSAKFAFVQFASIDIDKSGGIHVSYFASTDKLNYALYHNLSEDGGKTFLAETKISDVHLMRFSGDEMTGQLNGFDWSRIYPCPHIVIDPTTQALYAVWTANGISNRLTNGTDIYFSRSEDKGVTWSPAAIVNDDAPGLGRDQFHPSISVNKRGVLVITWYDRRSDASNRFTNYTMTTSLDGGRTFTPNVPISSKPMDMLTVGRQNDNFGIGEYTQVLTTDWYVIPFWADGRTNDGDLNIYTAVLPLDRPTQVEHMTSVNSEFRLIGLWPTPSSTTTSVKYELDRPMHVQLIVTDMLGRSVLSVVNSPMSAGEHVQEIPTGTLKAGSYLVTLITESGRSSTRLSVVR